MSMVCDLFAIPEAQLMQLVLNPRKLDKFFERTSADPTATKVYIDKAWHCIHFLLTGSDWGGDGSLALAVLGGEEIGEERGYGPARFLVPKEVVLIAAELAKIPREELGKRFDAKKLNDADIYPNGWKDGEGIEYYLENYEALQKFYQSAAAQGSAVLICIG